MLCYFVRINESLGDEFDVLVADTFGVRDEDDAEEPAEAEEGEGPEGASSSVPGEGVGRCVEDKDVLSHAWDGLANSVVMMGVSEVGLLEVVLLADEGLVSLRGVVHLEREVQAD